VLHVHIGTVEQSMAQALIAGSPSR
jgi:hypothetical protein